MSYVKLRNYMKKIPGKTLKDEDRAKKTHILGNN